ncbi:MAG: hypothetical protein QNJ98_08620 [Planctomycetota bacterium]|nr:hypothetical protein [Planctomycetota bacterium]
MMRWALVVLATCGLMACGGGGGGGGLNASIVSGDYTLIFVSIEDNGETNVSWGMAAADGVSLIAVTGSNNADGVVNPLTNATLEYAVGTDGTMTLGQSGTVFLIGSVRADGTMAVLGSVDDGEPGIVILLRPSGPYNLATATGTYGVSAFGAEASTAQYFSFFGTADFDGMGAASGSIGLNLEGNVTPGPIGADLTYTLAADGTSTLSSVPRNYDGAWAPGGDFSIFGGDTVGAPPLTDSDPIVWSFVRRGSGLDDADFVGSYGFAGVEFSGTGMIASSFSGTMTADGLGRVTFRGTRNASGTVGPTAEEGTYTVAADGAIEINRVGPTENIQGSMSPDGQYFIAGGGSENGSSTVFWVAFKN